MSVAERRRAEPESPGFAPVRMDDVELGAALPDLTRGARTAELVRVVAVPGSPSRKAARPGPGRPARGRALR